MLEETLGLKQVFHIAITLQAVHEGKLSTCALVFTLAIAARRLVERRAENNQ